MSFTPRADNAVANFLTEHPEHSEEFGYHRDFGPIMSTKGVRLFVAWALENGKTTPEKAAKMIEIMDEINRKRAVK